eukprot:scaffold369_cov177-Ochromonas_danica.AAC.24
MVFSLFIVPCHGKYCTLPRPFHSHLNDVLVIIPWNRERVLVKKCSELSTEGMPVDIAFGPAGKHLSILFPSFLLLLDLEAGTTLSATCTPSLSTTLSATCTLAQPPQKFLSAQWCVVDSIVKHRELSVAAQQLLLSRPQEETGDEAKYFSSLLEVFQHLHASVLHVVLANGDVLGFAYGLFPIYLLSKGGKEGIMMIGQQQQKQQQEEEEVVVPEQEEEEGRGSIPRKTMTVNFCSERNQMVLLHHHIAAGGEGGGVKKKNHLLLSNYPIIREKMNDLFQLARDYLLRISLLRGMETMLGQWSRKWKESLKVLPMKLSLATTLFTSTYEMNWSVPEIFLSLTTCGQWHPALPVIFSQHWNDQSIQRLRSNIDSTTRGILRYLRCRLLPRVHDIMLLTQDQMRLCNKLLIHMDDTTTNTTTSSNSWQGSLRQSAQLLLAADHAIAEAQYARERLLLVMQLVKDCWLEASQVNATHKPDLTLRGRCSELFSSNANRPPADQAEHLSASFLVYHLSPQPLSTMDSSSFSSSTTNSYYDNEVENIDKLLEEVAEIETTASKPSLSSSSQSCYWLFPQLRSISQDQERLLTAHCKQLSNLIDVVSSSFSSCQISVKSAVMETCGVRMLTHFITYQNLEIFPNSSSKHGSESEKVTGSTISVYEDDGVLNIIVAPINDNNNDKDDVYLSRLNICLDEDIPVTTGNQTQGSNKENCSPRSFITVMQAVLYEDSQADQSVTLLLLLECKEENNRRLCLHSIDFKESLQFSVSSVTNLESNSAWSNVPITHHEVNPERLFSLPEQLAAGSKDMGMQLCASRGILVVYNASHSVVVDIAAEEEEDDGDDDEEGDNQSK